MTEVVVRSRWRDVLAGTAFGVQIHTPGAGQRTLSGEYHPSSWCFTLREGSDPVLASARTELPGWNDGVVGLFARSAYELRWRGAHLCFVKQTVAHGGRVVRGEEEYGFPTFVRPRCPELGMRVPRWCFLRQSRIRGLLSRDDEESVMLCLSVVCALWLRANGTLADG